MTNIAVIIQARIGSSRLPGKILLPLGSRTALAQCMRRCQAIKGITHIVCAIPDGEVDDPVADESQNCGVQVVRGPLNDVLKRYVLAAESVQADIIMRVTSDCPLIDPETCSELLDLFLTSHSDYATNNMPPTWPHGFDAEIFTIDALRQADHAAVTQFDREHVTPWIRRAPFFKKTNLLNKAYDMSNFRLTLDFEEDYNFLNAFFRLLPHNDTLPDRRYIFAALQDNPELTLINRSRSGIRAIDPSVAKP